MAAKRLVLRLHNSRWANRSRPVAGNFFACFSRANARAVIAFLSQENLRTVVDNSIRFNQLLQRQDSSSGLSMVMMPRDSSFGEHFQLLACCRCSSPPRRSGRLTISAARTDVILLIRRIVLPFRTWPSGSLLEFLQLRSFDPSFPPAPSLGGSPFFRRGRAAACQRSWQSMVPGSFSFS